VGDLGDVVKLYEKVLQRADGDNLPVPANVQTECFLEQSASLLHFLNRRDQQKKNHALAFAQASGELLARSAKAGTGRLRQYTKLYVRVDAGPKFEEVANRILDLMDAGVFVYDGGTPRTKTRDSDPVLQFKLSFRKMLGLASFIGLSDRDRFELSGDVLRTWLEDLSQAKEILLESEAKKAHEPVSEAEAEDTSEPPVLSTDGERETVRAAAPTSPQLNLLTSVTRDVPAQRGPSYAPRLGVRVTHQRLAEWSTHTIDALVLALGFEERALVSAQRILEALKPRRILLVRYEGDQGKGIADRVAASGVATTLVSSIDELRALLSQVSGKVVVDSTGLSKPYLFTAICTALSSARHVSVVHTLAQEHYPKNDDLLRLGVVPDSPVSAEVLARMGEVLIGEAGPYKHMLVHHVESSPDRSRALIASASPKNDRLLYLLDRRPCDATRILVPKPTTSRRRIARAAAELAASAADANVALEDVDTNDIDAALSVSEKLYNDFYYRSGANVEVGLTGSKIHAVAFAALAAAGRVSAAWYVSPSTFDNSRFTDGVGDTECFDLDWDQAPLGSAAEPSSGEGTSVSR
jgi:hypothetical protein